MSWFSHLFSRPPAAGAESAAERFGSDIAIDVSGPEFRDLYPTEADMRRRIERSGLVRSAAVAWVSAEAATALRRGSRDAMAAIKRQGDLLTKDELRSLGLNTSRKMGRRYVEAIAANDIGAATMALEKLMLTAVATANKLHNLRRYEEAGIKKVILRPANDEGDTAIEKRFGGKRMTIPDARSLLDRHEDDIARSYFEAVVDI